MKQKPLPKPEPVPLDSFPQPKPAFLDSGEIDLGAAIKISTESSTTAFRKKLLKIAASRGIEVPKNARKNSH
jgi:hypothetical protein